MIINQWVFVKLLIPEREADDRFASVCWIAGPANNGDFLSDTSILYLLCLVKQTEHTQHEYQYNLDKISWLGVLAWGLSWLGVFLGLGSFLAWGLGLDRIFV
jgi:hypothetical protein